VFLCPWVLFLLYINLVCIINIVSVLVYQSSAHMNMVHNDMIFLNFNFPTFILGLSHQN
jgi:hypothetical protein